MSRMIFINLPVDDLAAAKTFYASVGAVNDPRFTDDTAACMTFSEHIHVMLLTHEKFSGFSPRPIPSRETAEVLLCLSADSREAVDAMAEAAWNAGGRMDPIAPQDYGFMYGRSFEDPDGHIWEVMWMDPAAAEKGPEAFAAEMEPA
ncbi:VOC family protein [Brevundimonas balnearis]|uniref:VOC family protein n=1 Tax=Brevundimonas balnearis TaxID=1572858 RepID=A0ABV6R0P9_9CAUL